MHFLLIIMCLLNKETIWKKYIYHAIYPFDLEIVCCVLYGVRRCVARASRK